jgi:hypothetical protein
MSISNFEARPEIAGLMGAAPARPLQSAIPQDCEGELLDRSLKDLTPEANDAAA